MNMTNSLSRYHYKARSWTGSSKWAVQKIGVLMGLMGMVAKSKLKTELQGARGLVLMAPCVMAE